MIGEKHEFQEKNEKLRATVKNSKTIKKICNNNGSYFWTTYSYDGCDFICAISKDPGCKGYGKHSNRPENYNLVGK